MSQENVEIIRAMWEPVKGLDTTTIDWDTAIRGLGQVFSPEVELRWSATGPEARVYRGLDGVAQAFREWVEPFSEYHVEPLDYIEAGDYVVVPNRQRGVGKTSGVPVELEVTNVYEFRGGQIARMDEYDTVEEALEAVGLPERDAHADSP
jgi:ketosteroid isomerase-like protein